MIYVGYQGIGKSTICRELDNCIDLESGNFFVEGIRYDNWYKIYANIAKHLSDQGKNVFVSSHKVLREYMNEVGIPFTVVFPSLKLKEAWINKLRDRYLLTHKDKDLRALLNAEQMYDENIFDLSKEPLKVEITDINYSLKETLKL